MDRQAVLIVAKELISDKRLSLTARLLLGFLLEHKNRKTGLCNPKRKTLARELGVSIPTIQRTLKELREAEMIRSKPGQHTSFYQIQVDQSDLPEQAPGGSIRSTKEDQFDPPDRPYPLMNLTKGTIGVRAPKRAAAVPSKNQTKNQHKNPPVPRKSVMSETLRLYYEHYAPKQKTGE